MREIEYESVRNKHEVNLDNFAITTIVRDDFHSQYGIRPETTKALKTIGSAGVFVAIGGVGSVGARKGASAEKNLVETAIELNNSGQFAGQFDTLLAAVIEAELVDTLSGRRQLTVFAPTDDAFDRILGIGPGDVGAVDDETLLSVLTYHVSPGRRYSGSVVSASMLPTLNGQRIDVDEELAGNIVATYVEASNGVIHVIDTVSLPS